MKRAVAKIVLTLAMATPLAVYADAPVKCPEQEPYKHRIALNYFGGHNSKNETGTMIIVQCLPREIKSEADWAWLHSRLEIKPKVTKITIVSAYRLSDSN